jgi:hypothetical protein
VSVLSVLSLLICIQKVPASVVGTMISHPYISCIFCISQSCGPGSSICIATGYGLDGLGIESQWGAKFLPPVYTGPGAHPAPCTLGIGSFPEGKWRPGRDADPSPPSSAVVMNLPNGPYGLYRASVPVQWCTLPFYLSQCTCINFHLLSLFLACRVYGRG